MIFIFFLQNPIFKIKNEKYILRKRKRLSTEDKMNRNRKQNKHKKKRI